MVGDGLDAALGELRAAGWPAPEDPDGDDDAELDGRDLICDRLLDEVGWLRQCAGWLTHLHVRGFFARSAAQIVLAVVVFLLWGGILLGVLPGQEGVSWQGHLFGALAGVLAAWLVAPQRTRRESVGAA